MIFDHSSVVYVSILTTHAVPGQVQNLNCAKSSSPTELLILWEKPAVLEDDVVGYQVQVKGLRHKDNTREVVEFDIVDFNTEMMEAFIADQLGTCKPQLSTCA